MFKVWEYQAYIITEKAKQINNKRNCHVNIYNSVKLRRKHNREGSFEVHISVFDELQKEKLSAKKTNAPMTQYIIINLHNCKT